jgi:hypothetical protein
LEDGVRWFWSKSIYSENAGKRAHDQEDERRESKGRVFLFFSSEELLENGLDFSGISPEVQGWDQ